MTGREHVIELWREYPPQEFAYDHSARMFLVDDKQVPIDQLHPVSAHHTTTTKTPEEIMDSTPVVLGAWGNPSQLPRMHEWLQVEDRKAEFAETRTVMREVYEEIFGEEFGARTEGNEMGFHVLLMRPGHPKFSVVGDCACLGVDPHAHPFSIEDWDEGLGSYSFHNVDTPAKWVGLYAGIGHMASLVLSE